jgi:hypothetical protein
MRSKAQVNFNLIFDPISKSAMIHSGDRVTWLAGPFATYGDAMAAAKRSLADAATKR